MTETRWLDDAEQHAWRGYLRMNTVLGAALSRQMQTESMLSMQDFEVLVHLTDVDDARLRVSELAKAMRWEKSRLSHHLSRMEKRGLIGREECTSDGRGAFIVLTPEGRAAIEAAAPAHVDAVRRHFFAVLTDDDLKALSSIADRVIARVEATDTCPSE
ncbi:MarR family winged helix-turn-helix transcriptional regulator [Jiangella sp. DSM 45060]|uniref:MarR family winged helix-turn-helix transcriptional regulator n=1 Tax=Jiangella sp. DSM 45060 TaxID=1798224 RepID=UPI00087D391B|nr:MarR family winged helix-turn-helix transcriptional regulator [Jiangella sp. DSM 45060]SDS28693.1 DNA-binding transcriptional regulator, MarR family [Jiangella sp. DSM 45060]